MNSEISESITIESYRDSLNLITKEGKRNFIHPKKPKGRYNNARNIFSIILLAILFGLPFNKDIRSSVYAV
jgi:hypothetical protein